MAEALLDAGADIHAKNDDGDTALMIAERGNGEYGTDEDVIKLLKKYGEKKDD